MRMLITTYREGDKDKAIELLSKYAKVYQDAGSQNEFYEKARLYTQLYIAQLMLTKGDWDSAIDALSKTFSTSPRLCNNENYVVFVLSVLKKLVKVSGKAVSAVLYVIDTIMKEVRPKESAGPSILMYMADVASKLGQKGYGAAMKIYELLLANVCPEEHKNRM